MSRDTVYRNTAELVSLGLLVESSSHVCKIANCNKGRTHFTGKWGHYTVAYNLNVPKIAELQNAERCLSGNSLKVGVAKCRKVNVAKSDTTLPIETATASSSLDPTQFDPSVTSADSMPMKARNSLPWEAASGSTTRPPIEQPITTGRSR